MDDRFKKEVSRSGESFEFWFVDANVGNMRTWTTNTIAEIKAVPFTLPQVSVFAA
ncbi:hypothetical protein Bca4012_015761 [Brassica carinata]